MPSRPARRPLAVAGFDWLTHLQLFERLLDAPLGVQVAAPLIGLLLAALALRYVAGGASSATTDEYIRNFHTPGAPLDLRPVPGRIAAAVATLGLGGAMGYEGPSIYLGSSGAAPGVSAIFKAPARGLVFALEVLYRHDILGRMLIPAGVASAVSYLVFVALAGTDPLFSVAGSPPFNLRDLLGAAVLGVLCGAGARLFAMSLSAARRLTAAVNPFVRAAAAGAVLAGLALLSHHLFGSALTLGAGYDYRAPLGGRGVRGRDDRPARLHRPRHHRHHGRPAVHGAGAVSDHQARTRAEHPDE